MAELHCVRLTDLLNGSTRGPTSVVMRSVTISEVRDGIVSQLIAIYG